MKVAVIPDDDGGCGAYRMKWPAQALAAQGADVDLYGTRGIDCVWQGILGPDLEVTDRLVVDVIPPDADVVVLQRPLRVEMVEVIRALQAHGRRVVVDIDDDFASIHPRNVSWRSVHPVHSPQRNHRHLLAGCAAADWVTVTTPALAERYGAHGRVSVVPNAVPARYLEVTADRDDDALVVGWTGTVQTHPTDLQVTGGAVARTCTELGAQVAVVGTGIGVGKALGLKAANVPGTGWLELDDYPQAMASFDVGIVPLADIGFNRAKSALKLMEFSALGVATVASPTPDNVRMAKHGCGVLAGRHREWERALRQLLTDEGWRRHVAERSRAAMANHTIEATAGRWMEAWTHALNAPRRAA